MKNIEIISKLLVKTFPNKFNKIQLYLKENIIHLTLKKNLHFNIFFFNLIKFIRDSLLMKGKLLIDLAVVDYHYDKDRFELNYIIRSLDFNIKYIVSVYLKDNEIIPSLCSIFDSANWLEREAWDLYGVYFFNHSDLRRILTDYGFNGFPFRKDFPLNGYIELRYDEEKQHLVYEPLEMSQEMRVFDFQNPFEREHI